MADGTVGNEPSAANPAGSSRPTAPQAGPPAMDGFEYTAGSVGNYPNAGMDVTVMQTSTAYGQATASADAYQAAAHGFIVENGAAVVAGHATVGDPGTTGGAGDVGEGGSFGGAGDADY